MSEISIREATENDAEEILDIYRPYVLSTAITFEYDVPSVEEFRERIRNTLKRYPYIVAVEDGKIKGYAYAGIFKNRAAYDMDVELSIYIDEKCKRHGLGKALYSKLEELLKRQNIINLYSCIATPNGEADEYLNNDSVLFHERLGYRIVGEFRRSGYKFNRWYNMVWMEKIIGDYDKVDDFIPYKNLANKNELF